MKKIIISLLISVTLYSVVWADLDDEFMNAAMEANFSEMERFLELGADVNTKDNESITALRLAA